MQEIGSIIEDELVNIEDVTKRQQIEILKYLGLILKTILQLNGIICGL